MVYEGTKTPSERESEKPGFNIFPPIKPESDATDMYWAIFTDDGKGNGNFVCYAADEYWAKRIAHSLDSEE